MLAVLAESRPALRVVVRPLAVVGGEADQGGLVGQGEVVPGLELGTAGEIPEVRSKAVAGDGSLAAGEDAEEQRLLEVGVEVAPGLEVEAGRGQGGGEVGEAGFCDNTRILAGWTEFVCRGR